MSEAERAYHGMHGARPYAELGLSTSPAVENTCMWVVTGSGLPGVLDRD